MENLNQTIPLLELACIGLLAFIMARRTGRKAAPLAASSESATSVSVAEVAVAEPIIVAPPSPDPANAPMAPVIAKVRKRRLVQAIAAKPVETKPVEMVIGLLQQKETLVAAFLLREILDPPVSRR